MAALERIGQERARLDAHIADTARTRDALMGTAPAALEEQSADGL
ncbi:hypothetical protein [Kitasatospora sp. NPDC056731]